MAALAKRCRRIGLAQSDAGVAGLLHLCRAASRQHCRMSISNAPANTLKASTELKPYLAKL